MLKNRPFLVASIIFAGCFLIMLVIAAVSFMIDSNLIANTLTSWFHLQSEPITNSTLAEFAVVFAIPAFIFGYKSLCDYDSEASDSLLPEEWNED